MVTLRNETTNSPIPVPEYMSGKIWSKMVCTVLIGSYTTASRATTLGFLCDA